jgi:hypothetical protein
MTRLDDSDMVALARDIRRMSKSQVVKIHATTPCAICSKAIGAGTAAQMLAKQAYAHQDCIRSLREKVDALLPQQEVAQAGELPFNDAFIEVE